MAGGKTTDVCLVYETSFQPVEKSFVEGQAAPVAYGITARGPGRKSAAEVTLTKATNEIRHGADDNRHRKDSAPDQVIAMPVLYLAIVQPIVGSSLVCNQTGVEIAGD